MRVPGVHGHGFGQSLDPVSQNASQNIEQAMAILLRLRYFVAKRNLLDVCDAASWKQVCIGSGGADMFFGSKCFDLKTFPTVGVRPIVAERWLVVDLCLNSPVGSCVPLSPRLRMVAKVSFPVPVRHAAFKKAANLIETKCTGGGSGRRSRAIAQVEVDEGAQLIRLKWAHACHYNSAYSWVKNVLSNISVAWDLSLVAGSKQQAEVSAKAAKETAQDFAAPKRVLSPAAPEQDQVSAAKRPKDIVSDVPLPVAWLPIKALELLRGAPICPTATQASDITLSEELGAGTFGVVRRDFMKNTGQSIVVKHLKSDDQTEFLREISILARLNSEYVIKLVDVLVKPKLALVLEDAGCSLAVRMKASPRGVNPKLCKQLFLQLLQGVQHLHDNLVVHTDLKPHNICVHGVNLRIVDLGCAIISLPGFRSKRTIEDVTSQGGLQYSTLWYRAIEILLGDTAFAAPVDCWSAGCVFAEMLSHSPLFKASSEQRVVLKIFETLGSPQGGDLDYLQKLPLWSSQFPAFPPQRLENLLRSPAEISIAFGDKVWPALKGLFALSPSSRWTARRAIDCLEEQQGANAEGANAQQGGLAPEGPGCIAPEGPSSATNTMTVCTEIEGKLFEGARSELCVLQGALGEDVLSYLRGALQGHETWNFKAQQPSKDRLVENAVKLEIAGHFGPSSKKRTGLTANGLDASAAHDVRLRAWVHTFKELSRKVLLNMQETCGKGWAHYAPKN